MTSQTVPYLVGCRGQHPGIAKLECDRFHLYRSGDVGNLLSTPSAILVSRDLGRALLSQVETGCRVREIVILDPPNGELAGFVELTVDAELDPDALPVNVSRRRVWQYGSSYLFVSPDLVPILSALFSDLTFSMGFALFAG
jgi:hypothetical protein